MEDLEDFFEDIDKLKHTERQGWKDREIERPRDTIASHSFGAALMGWKLSEEEDLDTDRVIRMLLMHDLIMAYIEDVTPKDEEFDSKKDREDEMFEELLEDVPENMREEFKQLFQEFRENSTPEAKVAHEADKIDTLMQARKYSEEDEQGYLKEFIESYREHFSSETGKKIYRELEEESRDTDRSYSDPE